MTVATKQDADPKPVRRRRSGLGKRYLGAKRQDLGLDSYLGDRQYLIEITLLREPYSSKTAIHI